MTTLDIRYAAWTSTSWPCDSTDPVSRKALTDVRARWRGRTPTMQALDKLTAVVDGRRVIVDHPPLIVRIPRPCDARARPGVPRRYKRRSPTTAATSSTSTTSSTSPARSCGVGSVGLRGR